jgi:ribonuclease E
MNRTKQELSRDYYVLLKIWRDIEKKAKEVQARRSSTRRVTSACARSGDYFTTEISEILVDDMETFRKCAPTSARWRRAT